MHGNVNVIYASCLCKVLLKVLHMEDQQVLFTGEILIDFPVLIEDMDYNQI